MSKVISGYAYTTGQASIAVTVGAAKGRITGQPVKSARAFDIDHNVPIHLSHGERINAQLLSARHDERGMFVEVLVHDDSLAMSTPGFSIGYTNAGLREKRLDEISVVSADRTPGNPDCKILERREATREEIAMVKLARATEAHGEIVQRLGACLEKLGDVLASARIAPEIDPAILKEALELFKMGVLKPGMDSYDMRVAIRNYRND